MVVCWGETSVVAVRTAVALSSFSQAWTVGAHEIVIFVFAFAEGEIFSTVGETSWGGIAGMLQFSVFGFLFGADVGLDGVFSGFYLFVGI